jgi:hypothetical protein
MLSFPASRTFAVRNIPAHSLTLGAEAEALQVPGQDDQVFLAFACLELGPTTT